MVFPELFMDVVVFTHAQFESRAHRAPETNECRVITGRKKTGQHQFGHDAETFFGAADCMHRAAAMHHVKIAGKTGFCKASNSLPLLISDVEKRIENFRVAALACAV